MEDLKGWWEPGRAHVENMYEDIKLPFNDFHRYFIISISVNRLAKILISFLTTELIYFIPVLIIYLNLTSAWLCICRVDDKHKIVRQMPMSSLIGYAKSSSAYQTLLKSQPQNMVLQQLQSRYVKETFFCQIVGFANHRCGVFTLS